MSKEQHDLYTERILQKGKEEFEEMKEGEVRSLPVGSFMPSQPDDGRRSNSNKKIDPLEIEPSRVVVNGNHRYYEARHQGPRTRVPVVKTRPTF